MKKTAILLAACLTLSLAACSSKTTSPSGAGSSSETSSSSMSSSSTGTSSSSSEASGSEAEKEATIAEMVAAGSVNGQTYTNSILGITYTMPEGWVVDNPEDTLSGQLERLAQTQGQDVADSNKKNIDAGYMGYLFYTSTTAETETSNILLQIASEEMIGDASPVDYANTLASSFEEGYKQFGIEAKVDEAEKIDINGHEVAVASVQVVMDGLINGIEFDNYHVSQAYSIYTTNGAVVVAMLSAFSDEDLEAGLNTLKTVSFAS